jgi:hypothetical protein
MGEYYYDSWEELKICRFFCWICFLKINILKFLCDYIEILKNICHVKRLKDMILVYNI